MPDRSNPGLAGFPPCRRFNLGDGLILTAAAALSLERLRGMGWFTQFPADLAWCLQKISSVGLWPPWDILFDGSLQGLRSEIAVRLVDDVLIQLLSSLSVGFMVAQPLLRLRHPRPEPHRLMRQSGFVACMASMAGALVAFAIVGSDWFSESALSLGPIRVVGLILLWIVSGLPPWRMEPSWIDRLGRVWDGDGSLQWLPRRCSTRGDSCNLGGHGP
jgi:hypothetical protein